MDSVQTMSGCILPRPAIVPACVQYFGAVRFFRLTITRRVTVSRARVLSEETENRFGP